MSTSCSKAELQLVRYDSERTKGETTSNLQWESKPCMMMHLVSQTSPTQV